MGLAETLEGSLLWATIVVLSHQYISGVYPIVYQSTCLVLSLAYVLYSWLLVPRPLPESQLVRANEVATYYRVVSATYLVHSTVLLQAELETPLLDWYQSLLLLWAGESLEIYRWFSSSSAPGGTAGEVATSTTTTYVYSLVVGLFLTWLVAGSPFMVGVGLISTFLSVRDGNAMTRYLELRIPVRAVVERWTGRGRADTPTSLE